jgi:hypothetical protein
LAQHIAEFNVYAMTFKMEKLRDYHLTFDDEDPAKIDTTKKKKPKGAAKEAEKKDKLEDIKEQEEDEKEEEEMKDKEAPEEEKNEKEKDAEEKEVDESKKGDESETKDETEASQHEKDVAEEKRRQAEVDKQEPIVKEEKFFINEKKEDSIENKFYSELVEGFRRIKVKIYPVSEDIEKLASKKKFQGLFDVISNGFLMGTTLKPDIYTKLLKPDGVLYQENA